MTRAKKDGILLPDLENAQIVVCDAKAYSFRFPGGGWAIYTVNDGTGEFIVQSDWGNWSYRWNTDPKCLGAATLTAFLRKMSDPWYVADKFHYGRPRDREEFDDHATKRGLRKRVGELYGCRKLDLERTKELLDLLDDLDWNSADSFVQSFYDHEDLGVLTAEPYEWIEQRPTASYIILVDALLPCFFNYLRSLPA